MPVDVTMLPAAIPADAPGHTRTVSYDDRPGENDPVEYQYSIHSSGALVVWRCFAEASPVVQVAYGPASWEKVQGTPHRTL